MRLLGATGWKMERTAIVLFELEGYSGKQIAELQAAAQHRLGAHFAGRVN